ncbi:hypothetical protein R3P82_12750 [Dietzia maris]|uniref:Uncharacterized protein n=1 Tax=Dietzia maris TaxID=37915 RepID=A0AAE4R0B8_9ACTN|nr:hypothetical protein [Dietzia maris]MDV6299979.1 hypothetical protein [Dietzia maris]
MAGTTDPAARLAAAWWDSLDDTRRVQIHRWVAGRDAVFDHPPIPGQTDLLAELDRTRS